FFGGEPLLNFPVVQELVAYGRQLEQEHDRVFRFTLTTNATLLTEEVQEFLNRERIAVVLSIDGRQQINDQARPYSDGSGSYQDIVPDMLRFAASRGHDNYYVRGTYTRHNLDFAADVAHLANLGFRHLSMEPVVGSPDEDYTLRHEDLPRLMEEYERLVAYYVAQHKAGRPFTFFHFNLSLDHGPCAIKRVTGCGAGYDYLAVTPSGELYPCHQFVGQPEWLIGNVEQGITRRNLSRQFQEVSLYSKPQCVDCWARFFCSGGCMAHAWFANGDFTKPEALACALQKKRLECALYALAALAEE
ncbi:MAG TPA: thioether cross-link-forming SCIFF peptide maturase, partial [Firmicutes bacterium]|nr:thioether cross-link-forming SCIFF peptide maturase [Bacillota bacterium]